MIGKQRSTEKSSSRRTIDMKVLNAEKTIECLRNPYQVSETGAWQAGKGKEGDKTGKFFTEWETMNLVGQVEDVYFGPMNNGKLNRFINLMIFLGFHF